MLRLLWRLLLLPFVIERTAREQERRRGLRNSRTNIDVASGDQDGPQIPCNDGLNGTVTRDPATPRVQGSR